MFLESPMRLPSLLREASTAFAKACAPPNLARVAGGMNLKRRLLISSVPILYNFFVDRFIAGFTVGAIK